MTVITITRPFFIFSLNSAKSPPACRTAESCNHRRMFIGRSASISLPSSGAFASRPCAMA
jgi:hypothetical protein